MSHDIKVKEPQNPVDGEFTLDQYGELVQYKNGEWIKNGR
jgi:hypothetical protein|tara:strand:+ start:1009 stop:1128 length:120 start_codon:yes stop_codon:yes gene_type:complete